MSDSVLEQSVILENYKLQKRVLEVRLDVTGDATPADKTIVQSNLGGLVYHRFEGLTADADAAVAESISFTTAVDATNTVFGILVVGENDELRTVDRVLYAECFEASDATAVGTAAGTITLHGTNGVTADGNLAMSITMAGITSDSENSSLIVRIVYMAR